MKSIGSEYKWFAARKSKTRTGTNLKILSGPMKTEEDAMIQARQASRRTDYKPTHYTYTAILMK